MGSTCFVENHTEIKLNPVAIVRNEIAETGLRDSSETISDIIVNHQFSDALDGLGQFSHMIIIFWMHKSPAWDTSMSKTHPQRRTDLPLVGIFATRSPVRPNPIGVTVVELLGRKDNILTVKGLDTVDNTPVLDIKPYFPPKHDERIKVPDWVNKLNRMTRH